MCEMSVAHALTVRENQLLKTVRILDLNIKEKLYAYKLISTAIAKDRIFTEKF